MEPIFYSMGEGTIVMQLGEKVNKETNQIIQSVSKNIKLELNEEIINVIPSFINLTVLYDLRKNNYKDMKEKILSIYINTETSTFESKKIHLPIIFSKELSPDLEMIAKKSNQEIEEVKSYFLKTEFYTFMTGFIAGYPYCGPIKKEYFLERREQPRLKVPKGSVQIANDWIGIATIEAPSGWHIIGKTPIDLFNHKRKIPSLINPGDTIKFIEIDNNESFLWDEERQGEWNQKWNL